MNKYRTNMGRRFPVPVSILLLWSTPQSSRFRCCFKGKANDPSSNWPKLETLPEDIIDIIIGKSCVNLHTENGDVVIAHSLQNHIDHFSRNSARYNGILSISASGVDNGKGGEWERIRGPHAVKLCGRTYHYMPRSNTTGGIQHFIMDKYTEALMHGQSFQTKSSEKNRFRN
jgi:hypothetical protein